MLVNQLVQFTFPLLLFFIHGGYCWDLQELELFDLVEEINANFYEVLGVEQTATSAEIRKAYRKLSVKLHPDKNKEEGAEDRFRKIVAIYEVLKDEQQRIRYNEVLANGLPDWRTPVYYYRKARKLGLLELAILLFIIITIGQFIVGWSMYLEKKFEMEEVFLSKKKKDKKGKKAKQAEKDVDDALQEHLDTLPRPKLTNLLPCKLVFGLVGLFTSIPSWVEQFKEWREQRKQLKEESSEEEPEEEEMEEKIKRPKRRQRVDIPEYDQLVTDGAPVIYMPEAQNHIEEKRDNRTGQEWTDDEVSFLAKAVAKFPSGTQNRWEKIAEMVGRSVSEVTTKCKSIKQKVTISVDPASQGLTGSVTEKLSFKKGMLLSQDITQACAADNAATKPECKAPTESAKSEKITSKTASKTVDKPANNTTEKTALKATSTLAKSTSAPAKSTPAPAKSSSAPAKSSSAPAKSTPTPAKSTPVVNNQSATAAGGASGGTSPEQVDRNLWTQTQQKTLEWALGHYPKGTPERWERVAEHIAGKTKEDCMARFKYLADVIKRKKVEAAIAKDITR